MRTAQASSIRVSTSPPKAEGGYGGERALEMLRELPKYGVNSIALVPYGMTRRGSGAIRFGGMERDDDIVQIAQVSAQTWNEGDAEAADLVSWRFIGDLEFPNEPERSGWFEQYRAFITHHAELAARIQADVFCVGTELSKLSVYDAEWRRIIRYVRKIYKGPLTCAAVQGPEFEESSVLGCARLIGLNNYYPLPDDLSTAAIVAKVEAVQRKFRKPVIFPKQVSRAWRRRIARLGTRRAVSCRWRIRRDAMRRSSTRSGPNLGSRGCIGGRSAPMDLVEQMMDRILHGESLRWKF